MELMGKRPDLAGLSFAWERLREEATKFVAAARCIAGLIPRLREASHLVQHIRRQRKPPKSIDRQRSVPSGGPGSGKTWTSPIIATMKRGLTRASKGSHFLGGGRHPHGRADRS